MGVASKPPGSEYLGQCRRAGWCTAGRRTCRQPGPRIICARQTFILIISPVFMMLALFGTAGSAAWERTQSLVLAVIAGVWCAMVAILIALCVAFCLNLAFEGTMELQLHEAFAASGMNDPGAFLVKNMLEATSEGLVRMPIIAVFLSFNPTSPARMQLRSLPTRRPQCLDQALNREIQVFHRRFFFLYILNALPT
jgi:hypothetical protein